MKRVDYDTVAPAFDRRYETSQYTDIDAVVRRFVAGCQRARVAEVGCGTGHWLARIEGLAGQVFGADLSAAMLMKAGHNAPNALLVRATAEMLPWADASFARLFCVNAIHHFSSAEQFVGECRRVLEPGGSFLAIALDPHLERDTWWVYDYFPAAVALDRERYPSTKVIRKLLTQAGFVDTVTTVAQRIPAVVPFAEARAQGLLDRRNTSQLMVISDEDYAAGIARIEREQPLLRADLTLFATAASVQRG